MFLKLGNKTQKSSWTSVLNTILVSGNLRGFSKDLQMKPSEPVLDKLLGATFVRSKKYIST